MLRKQRPASASTRPPGLLLNRSCWDLGGAADAEANSPPPARVQRPFSASAALRKRSGTGAATVVALDGFPPPVPPPESLIQLGSYSTTYRTSGEPTLLVELQRFIRKELHELGGDSLSEGDPTRLAVFRHAFQSFIQDFKSYSTLLSTIKHEYDRHIEHLSGKVQVIPQLESELALHKYEVAEQQTVMVRELVDKIDTIKKESAKWRVEAEKHKALVTEAQQKIAEIGDELDEKNARIRDEELHRTMIIENETKLMNQVSENQQRLTEQETAIKELTRDNAFLAESLNAANAKMADLKEQYRDTVPHFEFELLQAEHDSYKSRFEQQRDLTVKMHQQTLEIQQKHEHFIRDLEKRFAERLRTVAPDWDYISKRCPGNIETFWTPCNGMNCNETIVTLIHLIIKGGVGTKLASIGDENSAGDRSVSASAAVSMTNLAGVPVSRGKSKTELSGDRTAAIIAAGGISLKSHRAQEEKQTFFVGLGFSAGIPRYLRCKGRVKNRNLTKKNTILLIRDVWTTKAEYDKDRVQQEKPLSPLNEYLYQYLKKRFSVQDAIAEWGYNIVEACRTNKPRDCECWLFLDILEGRLEESVYHHVLGLVETVRTTFTRLDANLNDGVASGMVPKAIVLNTLGEMWKHKVPNQVKELYTALEADQPQGDIVTYSMLFQSALVGESAFIEAIKMQEMEERAQYMRDLEAAVLQYHGATVTALTSVEFARVIGRFDVDKKKADVDEFVARGFSSAVDKIKPRDTMQIGRFLANLSRGVLKRG
ncbi:hypothetical protein BC828DRAFT_373649 [Blastocladiella britannica]|nr:hypothetical protein BC828DRAFT_373649 [Blastocladiella britannica]